MNSLKVLATATIAAISLSITSFGFDRGSALPETFGPDGPRPTTGKAGGPPIHVAMGGHGFWEVYLPGEREYADKYGGDCRGG